jgi:hypothetical protein
MLNPGKLLKLKSYWEAFSKNHPKFQGFLNAVKNEAIEEGTIFEINVTTPEGRTISSNLKLNEADMKLIKELSGLF